MSCRVAIPGERPLEIEHLVLDLNGTLTNRGNLIAGVSGRLFDLGARMSLHVLSAGTFGTLDEVSRELDLETCRISSGTEKRRFVERLGAERCAAIGNGKNDVLMLGAAALGIAVVGPEGANVRALMAADIVCLSILDALDMLLDDQTIGATLPP